MTDDEARAELERAAYAVSKVAADLDDLFSETRLPMNLLGFRDDLREIQARMLQARAATIPEPKEEAP